MARWETALVTGGSTGIGLAIAKELASRGTKVVICGRRQEELDKAVVEIGNGASAIQCDVANVDAVQKMVDEAHARLGSLHLVIANAGFGGDKHASRIKIGDIVPMLQTNVIGACATLTASIPYLVAQKRGQLVGVSSLAGYRGLPAGATYSASKAALSTFLESIRVDLRSFGIRVTDIRPGFVATPLTAKNKFKMPFIMPADRAARKIVNAIAAERRVYAFPWPTWLALKAIVMLPGWLYDRIGGLANAKVRKEA